MKMKKLVKAVVGCVALTLVAVGVVAAKSATEAKAFDFFDKDSISIKKCAISFEQDSYEWTGKEIKPVVRVNYKGTDLEKGVDYVLKYGENIDAGRGYVVVTGKGKYKSTQKAYFDIKGIDIKRECDVAVVNKGVKVYYQGKELEQDKDYWVNTMRQEFLTDSLPAPNGSLNTYKVTTYYVVSGKGRFEGAVTKNVVTTERRYE